MDVIAVFSNQADFFINWKFLWNEFYLYKNQMVTVSYPKK